MSSPPAPLGLLTPQGLEAPFLPSRISFQVGVGYFRLFPKPRPLLRKAVADFFFPSPSYFPLASAVDPCHGLLFSNFFNGRPPLAGLPPLTTIAPSPFGLFPPPWHRLDPEELERFFFLWGPIPSRIVLDSSYSLNTPLPALPLALPSLPVPNRPINFSVRCQVNHIPLGFAPASLAPVPFFWPEGCCLSSNRPTGRDPATTTRPVKLFSWNVPFCLPRCPPDSGSYPDTFTRWVSRPCQSPTGHIPRLDNYPVDLLFFFSCCLTHGQKVESLR